ncbi:hypothetical protein GEMRC1_012791 [Eukaryota sp. GEM-RC1]
MPVSLSDRCSTKLPSEVFALHISPNSNLVAAGLGDGTIAVLSTSDAAILYTLVPPSNGQSDITLPVTAVKWRPCTSSSSTKNVLLSGHSDGFLNHWHVTSGQLLHSIEEVDNQIYAVDYSKDDLAVRVYDEQTKSLVCLFKKGLGRSIIGHSNRIFSIRFSPLDPSIIFSTGWDNNVVAWDMRTGAAIRSFYGPHCCGDSLNITRNGRLLIGSWRNADQLEIYQSDGTLVKQLDVDHDVTSDVKKETDNCLIYAARFLSSGSVAIVGGSGVNCSLLIDIETGQHLGRLFFKSAVYSIDTDDVDFCVIGTGDGLVRMVDVNFGVDYDEQEGESQSFVTEVKNSSVVDSPGGVRWNRVMGKPIMR